MEGDVDRNGDKPCLPGIGTARCGLICVWLKANAPGCRAAVCVQGEMLPPPPLLSPAFFSPS